MTFDDDNVIWLGIKWHDRFVVHTRRQRRTGKTIFVVTRIVLGGKECCNEHDDPVELAKTLLYYLQHGASVEWKGETPFGIRPAEVIPLPTASAEAR
jgi:hypothetical protein